MQMRYDQDKDIYRNCRFCGGSGCLACSGEADRAYRKEFPDGPKPVATFSKNNKKEMEQLGEMLKKLIHPVENKDYEVEKGIGSINIKCSGRQKRRN